MNFLCASVISGENPVKAAQRCEPTPCVPDPTLPAIQRQLELPNDTG
jgi:hypothetical protein